jgi:predicted dehydrogenase
MANEKIKIGIIGLDTSHVTAFTELLNNEEHPYHVTGGTVVVAYPGGSPDFELSYSRVVGFTEKLRDQYGVQIVQSPEEVAELCDAILLESVDGRVHMELFKRVAPYRKPVFIDKPLAVSLRDAQDITDLVHEYDLPVMSSSSLRYAEGFTQAIANSEKGEIFGVDCYGPMGIQETQPGLFWYGIHTVEMLFTVLGKQCTQVAVTMTEDHDLIVGTWADGRIGTIRGNRKDNYSFGAVLHRNEGSQFVDVSATEKPMYASLLEKIIAMFTGGTPDVPLEETKQIIRFIEAANESRLTGQIVLL